MTELLEQYLRLGLVHFMAFPETMQDESLLLPTLEKIAADPMFRCIEIKAIEDESLIRPVVDLAAGAGLDIVLTAQPAVLAGGLDPGSAERKESERAFEVLKHHVDQACALGAESVALLSGPDPVEFRKKMTFNFFMRTVWTCSNTNLHYVDFKKVFEEDMKRMFRRVRLEEVEPEVMEKISRKRIERFRMSDNCSWHNLLSLER